MTWRIPIMLPEKRLCHRPPSMHVNVPIANATHRIPPRSCIARGFGARIPELVLTPAEPGVML